MPMKNTLAHTANKIEMSIKVKNKCITCFGFRCVCCLTNNCIHKTKNSNAVFSILKPTSIRIDCRILYVPYENKKKQKKKNHNKRIHKMYSTIFEWQYTKKNAYKI